MISYELAKQLKDAGFPQDLYVGDRHYSFISHPRMGIPSQWSVNIRTAEIYLPVKDDECKIPTLSELIEACGDRFYSLVYATDNDWRCFVESRDQEDYISSSQGSSPEEAVANLWLALNKK